MKDAIVVFLWSAFGIGCFITVVTLIFAFSIGIRILGFLIAIFGVIWFVAFVVWSWWIECVVEPFRNKRNLKKRK